MSSPFNQISLFTLVVVLISITTVTLPEVRATDLEPQVQLVSVQNSELIFKNNYSGVLGTLNDNGIKTLEKIQQQESQKIKDELERRRLEEERLRREAEAAEAARIAKLKAVQQPIISSLPAKISGDFEGVIRNSCATYGCNPDQLIRIMYCESGGRSNAVNGIHKGLFQFNPNTFNANAKRAGIPGADIWDPYSQITVASWMFANGQAWQWSCK